jgi:hypothetical protein
MKNPIYLAVFNESGAIFTKELVQLIYFEINSNSQNDQIGFNFLRSLKLKLIIFTLMSALRHKNSHQRDLQVK